MIGEDKIKDAWMLLFSGALKVGEEVTCFEDNYTGLRYTLTFLSLDVNDRIERSYLTKAQEFRGVVCDGFIGKINAEERIECGEWVIREWYRDEKGDCEFVYMGSKPYDGKWLDTFDRDLRWKHEVDYRQLKRVMEARKALG